MQNIITKRDTYKCKTVLLGEQSVGKSSLALRFVKQTFSEFHEPTIGAAFLTKHIELDDCRIKFEIWDTAGQERYHSLAPMYYRGSNAAIVMYDITQQESFHRAKKWIEELYLQCNSEILIMLAGNKSDMTEERMVAYKDAHQYAKEQNLLFTETSAKLNQNIDELFKAIGKHCPKKAEISTPTLGTTPPSNIQQNHCCANT